MLIAKEKRRNNIAEYIIYMWHVEDMTRACKFNLDTIKNRIVEPFKANDTTTREMEEWYESIIHMMHEQQITEKGHLNMLRNTIVEMSELHSKLLQSTEGGEYRKLNQLAQHNILLFRSKSGLTEASDIEVCLNALYSLLLLKMSGKEISVGTAESMESFSNLLALLSQKFKDWEEGKLETI